jgi:hypothetical protein
MKENLILVLILVLFSLGIFLIFEPEIIESSDVSVSQEVTADIALSCDSSVSGLSAISGINGGTSNGSFSCTSTTNNSAGYNLKLKKTGLLCHSGGCGENKQFDDYPGTTSDPIDFLWQDTPSGQEYWGFNMTAGDDVTQRFKDNGSQCNTGTNVTPERCWVRVPTNPTEETVANRNSPTSESGSLSSFGIRIQAGSNNFLFSGTYTTTLVLTAAMN